ncbi:MAG: heme exporter protein CcmD [Reyranellaceae bacterium]
MESTGDFLAMGGHGIYVWPAFAIAIGVLAAMAIQAWLARRGLARLLEQRQGDRQARPRPGSHP